MNLAVSLGLPGVLANVSLLLVIQVLEMCACLQHEASLVIKEMIGSKCGHWLQGFLKKVL